MIYIASDHGGFELKADLIAELKRLKIPFRDLGPKRYSPKDDYPEFSAKVAKAVAKKPKTDQGILICRSGAGVCIAANKFKGIRAALCWNEQVAKASRQDDDANILCLPSDYISPELALRTTQAWLGTSFSFEPRHLRRIDELNKLER